jgi:hypothetical protein
MDGTVQNARQCNLTLFSKIICPESQEDTKDMCGILFAYALSPRIMVLSGDYMADF